MISKYQNFCLEVGNFHSGVILYNPTFLFLWKLHCVERSVRLIVLPRVSLDTVLLSERSIFQDGGFYTLVLQWLVVQYFLDKQIL